MEHKKRLLLKEINIKIEGYLAEYILAKFKKKRKR